MIARAFQCVRVILTSSVRITLTKTIFKLQSRQSREAAPSRFYRNERYQILSPCARGWTLLTTRLGHSGGVPIDFTAIAVTARGL